VHLNSKIKDITGYAGNFTVRTEGEEIKAGAIIVTTGAHDYRPTEHLYGQDERVITQSEFEERMAKGTIKAKNIVMIQCVGSRNAEAPYWSRIC